ncbi:cytochrome b/b6 domain-containing protein [uncultured Gilvimarinus sp.]|uniref:cytochrome b n=1 Tax=uncultured Gilvimarinus sp. TaxID=1689143 RepID=UPI0030ED464B|tara:strand:+ start:1866 stop:2396 length:531 start_codon:yes stop_codon:yes gene_type:complete
MPIRDNQIRYGSVSRFFHWSMVAAILWQFTSVFAHILLEDTGFDEFMWGTHKMVGFLIFVLALLRLLWALSNLGSRPPELSLASRLGHIGLYALFLGVPAVALLRQYGSGRAFEPFGLPIFAGFDSGKISWMTDLGSLLHSNLGWVLLLAIVGHVSMVVWHRRQNAKQDVLPRMLG